jgi:hypothetical protein
MLTYDHAQAQEDILLRKRLVADHPPAGMRDRRRRSADPVN